MGRARRDRSDTGSVLVVFLVAFAAVGAMLALTLNIGQLYSVRGGLQNGADAAALAAAARLNGTQEGLDEGLAAAIELAGLHATHASDGAVSMDIDPADVTFGSWSSGAGFAEIAGRGPADLRDINAVRIRGGREAARGNAVPVVFGGAFVATTRTDVSSAAVAAGGGPCEEDCAFPAAVADCRLLDGDGALRCGQILVLNEDYQDSLGFTSLSGAPANAVNVEQALNDLQAGGCPPATRVGDAIRVSNRTPPGVIVDEPWFAGLPKQVTVPVVEAACGVPFYEGCTLDDGVCTNARFVGDMVVTGYATFRVCHVTGPSVTAWPPPGWPAECGAPPGPGDFNGAPVDPVEFRIFIRNSLFLQLMCDVDQPGAEAGRAGCSQFGTSSPRSALVR